MAVAAQSALLVFILIGTLFPASAGQNVPAYKIGDVAKEEIKAPFKMVVFNAEATRALREKEALRVPAIFRFDPSVPAQTESNLLATLNIKREEFQNRLETVFVRRTLSPKNIQTPRYQRLVGNFLRQNRAFPVTTNLLELWATGQSDQSIRKSLVAPLHAIAALHIRADSLPADFKLGAQARIVTATNSFSANPATEGMLTQRSNILTLTKARAELVKTFSADQRLGRTLAAMLRPNCVLELDQSKAARAKRTDPLWITDNYEPGDIIAATGQTVDTKVAAALAELGEALRIRQLQQQALVSPARPQQNPWVWLLVSALALTVVLLSLRFSRRAKVNGLLPARTVKGDSSTMLIACPSCEENISVPLSGVQDLIVSENPSEAEWKQRALSAEARATAATTAVKQGVVRHLARLFREQFVAKLSRDRSALLETQQQANTSVAALEARLREVNAPLQERLIAYQNRIAELEKELTCRGEENRELIKAKIQLAKTQSELAKAKDQMEFN